MHAVLTSIGTDGDVFPYVGLGDVLHRRGHRVTLAAAEGYRSLAREFGLEFEQTVPSRHMQRVLSNPDMWHPIKGPYVMARWGVTLLDRQFESLAKLCANGDAVLIANPGLVCARVVQDKLGTPLASVILQPWMIKSSISPPVMPAGLSLPRWAPRPMAAAYWRLINGAGDLLIGRELNQLRRSLGLPPVRRVFDWWLSPDLMIGLFPDWYGMPQTDWNSQLKLCGFPMFDGRVADSLPTDLRRFCEAGPPPIAFTFGTGMMHGARLFEMAVAACAVLGMRGVLLTRHSSQLPQRLPMFIHRCDFAPFTRLFPLCAAIVHHGGIGTVAKALAAGVPQLVMPMAFDQLDNAIRVKRLGAGDFLRPLRANPQKVAHRLRGILTPQMISICQSIASRFACAGSLETAASLLERFAEDSRSSTIHSK